MEELSAEFSELDIIVELLVGYNNVCIRTSVFDEYVMTTCFLVWLRSLSEKGHYDEHAAPDFEHFRLTHTMDSIHSGLLRQRPWSCHSRGPQEQTLRHEFQGLQK